MWGEVSGGGGGRTNVSGVDFLPCLSGLSDLSQLSSILVRLRLQLVEVDFPFPFHFQIITTVLAFVFDFRIPIFEFYAGR